MGRGGGDTASVDSEVKTAAATAGVCVFRGEAVDWVQVAESVCPCVCLHVIIHY